MRRVGLATSLIKTSRPSPVRREEMTNAANTIFSEDSARRRSLELQRRERRTPAARCPRKDSRAFMRVHRDTAWAPDNTVPYSVII